MSSVTLTEGQEQQVSTSLKKHEYIECHKTKCHKTGVWEPAIYVCKHIVEGDHVCWLKKPAKNGSRFGEAVCHREHSDDELRAGIVACYHCFEPYMERVGRLLEYRWTLTPEVRRRLQDFVEYMNRDAKRYNARETRHAVVMGKLIWHGIFAPADAKKFDAYKNRAWNKVRREKRQSVPAGA